MRKFILFSLIVFSSSSFASKSTYADLIEGKFTAGNDDSFEKEVYANPDVKSQVLGKLKFVYSSDFFVSKFISPTTDKMYESPFFEGRCGESKYVFSLLKNPTMKNGFSNLGEGPWGKEGWATAKLIDITKGDYEKLAIDSKCHSDKQSSEVKEVLATEKESTTNEEMFISLVPEKFAHSALDFDCYAGNKKIDPEICLVYDEKCSSQKLVLKKNPPIQISVKDFSGRIITEIPKLKILLNIGSKDKKYITTLLPPNTKTSMYFFEEGEYKQTCFKDCGPYLITLERPPHKMFQKDIQISSDHINVELPKKLIDVEFTYNQGKSVHKNAYLYVGMNNIENLDDRPSLIHFAEGKYELSIYDSNHEFVVNKEIIITGKETGKVNVAINGDEFKKLDKQFRMEDLTEYQYFYAPTENSYLKNGIVKSAKVTFNDGDSSKDITNFFTPHNGYLLNSATGIEFLRNPNVSGVVKMEGLCSYAELKPMHYDYKLYGKDKKTEIGILRTKYVQRSDAGVLEFEYVSPKKTEPFKPNWENDYCESEKTPISSHFVEFYNDRMSNLGWGPWGSEAWIEHSPRPITSISLPVRWRNETYDSFRKEGNVYILEKHDDENNKVYNRTEVPANQIQGISSDCNLGC